MEAPSAGDVIPLNGRSATRAAAASASGRGSPLAAMHLPDLLAEVQTRLDALARGQARVQELLDAFLTVSTGLDLDSTLERVVQAAAGLVDARYGALGALGADGQELDTFVTVGMDARDRARTGHPHGRGILGRLITDPQPLRLTDLNAHPASVGMPADHPPMRSFLGVPIRAHGRIFGNLYVTEKRSGEFSAEDEALLSALAGAAGIAIENARSFEEGELRRRWLSAGGEVRTALDRFGPEAAPQVVVDRVLQLASADGVWLMRETDADRRVYQVVAVAGPTVDDCTGARIGPGDFGVLATLSAGPVTTVDLAEVPTEWPDTDKSWGPAMLAHMQGNDSGHGLLLVARHAGRPAFDPCLGEMIGSFAAQVALALDAEARQQVLRCLEVFQERDRIGRDLHDHVLQRLYATGLGIQSLATGISDPGHQVKLRELMGQLDQTVRDIRTSILDLRVDES